MKRYNVFMEGEILEVVSYPADMTVREVVNDLIREGWPVGIYVYEVQS